MQRHAEDHYSHLAARLNEFLHPQHSLALLFGKWYICNLHILDLQTAIPPQGKLIGTSWEYGRGLLLPHSITVWAAQLLYHNVGQQPHCCISRLAAACISQPKGRMLPRLSSPTGRTTWARAAVLQRGAGSPALQCTEHLLPERRLGLGKGSRTAFLLILVQCRTWAFLGREREI